MDLDTNSRFHLAVEKGDVDTIRDLFRSNEPPDINSTSDQGHTALRRACDKGHLGVVQFLVDGGADVTVMGPGDELAIHQVCLSRHSGDRVAILRTILNKNHDLIDSKDFFRQTCLHIATHEGDGEVVRWLLDEGADPSTLDRTYHTAWDFANMDSKGERIESFTAFVLKEAVDGIPRLIFPHDDVQYYLDNPVKCGNTEVYWCRGANKHDICLLLKSLSARYDSIAQAWPRVYKELCVYRSTKTGLKCREPMFTFEQWKLDYTSVVIPYLSVKSLRTVYDRDTPTTYREAKYCVGNRSDSFGEFKKFTLDEYCYPALPETALDRRNQDQTITRLYELAELRATDDSSPREQYSEVSERKDPHLPLIVVGQAWIWKVNNVVVATDTGDRVSLGTFRNEIVDSGASDVLKVIAKVFALLIEPSRWPGWEEDDIFDLYATAIVYVAEDVENYVKQTGVESMGINQEKSFLHQINDMREEFAMIRRVLTQQEEVWADFASNTWPKIWAKSQEGRKPYYVDATDDKSGDERALIRAVLRPGRQIQKYRRRVDQLDEDAERVERSITSQLDLKAKHASLRESHATAVMSAAVFGFTVITIVFTPLSFVMSLFALPIRSFQQNQIPSVWTDQAGMYTTNYIGKWTATAELVSVGLTVAASWLALEFGLEFPITARVLSALTWSSAAIFCFVTRNTTTLIGRFRITRAIWYWSMSLFLAGDQGEKRRYVERTMKQLQRIRPSDRGLRLQLEAIFSLDDFYSPVIDQNGSVKYHGSETHAYTHHLRWRRRRRGGRDEGDGKTKGDA